MKYTILILVKILISTGLLYAQTDFRQGYIIKNSGDTLYGKIDYRRDMMMSNICKFKDTNSIICKYSPNDILAYRFIDSKYFISKEINSEKYFLEFLINGKMNIYYLCDNEGEHYYIEKEDMEMVELPYEEGIKYIDNQEINYSSKTHIGLLIVYTQDAPGLKERVELFNEPEHSSLIKLAKDYHNAVCKDEECIIYEKEVPFIKMSFEPFWGLTKYHNFESSNNFINEFGLHFYFNALRPNDKFYLKTGIMFSKISEKEETIKILKIPLQIQYVYPAYKIKPKLSMGFNILKEIGNKNNTFESYTLCLNTGFYYKKVSISLNSEYMPIMFTIDSDAKFSIISYSLNFGFYFD